MIEDANSKGFHVALTRLAHQKARQLSARAIKPNKMKESYLNYLAIYAVQYYLTCLNIEVSPGIDVIEQVLLSTSYLTLQSGEKIECIPILPDEHYLCISLEVQEDRIGYVAVKLNLELTEANILGFVKQAKNTQISLKQLQSIEYLPVHIEAVCSTPSSINLKQWIRGIFEQDWQSLENIFGQSYAVNFRHRSESVIERAKLVKIQTIDSAEHYVILSVAVMEETEEKLGIKINLSAGAYERYLPNDTRLTLLSPTGEKLYETIARLTDNWIELPYIKGKEKEEFEVVVALDTNHFSEKFIL
ncbi:MAG: hypothetical protein RLZZ148_2152 [Cyanobacteriota bacterium]